MRARFFLFAASVVFAGCNALLGIESSSFDPPDAAVGDDATPPGPDARTDDAKTNDVVVPPDVAEGGPADTGSDARDAADADADADADVEAGEVCPKDCLGGACKGGECQPFTVIDLGTQALSGLTAAGESVYWTNASKRALQTATGVATAPVSVVLALPATNAFNDGNISSDATHVYFAEEDATDDANITYRVERIEQTARNGTAETIADALPFPPTDVIAEGPTNIVWSEFVNGRVLRCGNVPCGAPDIAAPNETQPTNLSTRSGRMAWSSLATKEVRLRPTGGGMPTTLLTGTTSIGAVLVLKTGVVYSDLGIGFFAHDFSPTQDRPLDANKNVSLTALDPDGETIWYASSTGSKVGILARVPAAADAGAPEVVATGLETLRALAVGTRGVYWLDTSGPSHHAIKGVAK